MQASSPPVSTSSTPSSSSKPTITYVSYTSEKTQLKLVQNLFTTQLSEPYSIFTYRFFLNQWPKLCILAMVDKICCGCILGKLQDHPPKSPSQWKRGYIAMLAVDTKYRRLGIGSTLVKKCISVMKTHGAKEVVLETETSNRGSLKLYHNLGFLREKALPYYYLNNNSAYRLKLVFPSEPS